jgi:hypothetical protein
MSDFNFITKHTIGKIFDMVRDRQMILKYDGFLYFNDPVKSNGKVINRINLSFAYEKEQVLPVSLYHLQGSALMEIYQRLKLNEFFVYKRVDGRDYKIRLKNEKDKVGVKK